MGAGKLLTIGGIKKWRSGISMVFGMDVVTAALRMLQPSELLTGFWGRRRAGKRDRQNQGIPPGMVRRGIGRKGLAAGMCV